MAASDRDRMAKLAHDLAAIETDDEATGPMFERAIEAANRDRAKRGLPPLVTDAEPPEEEFYRRARALGLRRHRG